MIKELIFYHHEFERVVRNELLISERELSPMKMR